MSVPALPTGKPLLYRDVLEFIHHDVCAYFMKRLAAHDAPTYQHSVRTALLSHSLAAEYGMDERERTRFLRSVLLHDIGLLTVAPKVLRSGSWLSLGEQAGMMEHPLRGIELLRDLTGRGLVDPDVILLHHENLDGSGYPFGKRGDELGVPVRLLRVVDSFDDAVYNRKDRYPKSADDAVMELYRWSDICYDADAVEKFHRLLLRTMGGGDRSPAGDGGRGAE